MTTLAAALTFQLRLLRRSPDQLLALVTAPMMTLIFLAISRHAGRADLEPYAVLAPALIALWGMALLTAGEIVAGERDNGSLELLIATPAAFPGVIIGRITGVAVVSLAGFVESWLAAWLVFRVAVQVAHPAVFAATLVVTLFSMAGTASMMSAVFVLARSARTFQNSLSYPFYVLGGVLVPVALLPAWLRPTSRAVFLSWSSDLLRDALAPAEVRHVLPRLAAVTALGLVGYVTGVLLLRRAVNRARITGSVGYA
jgi:ABC-2 type transport system permease protein